MDLELFIREITDVIMIAMRIDTKGYFYLAISLLTGALLPVILDTATNMNIFEFLMLAYMVSVPVSYMLIRVTHRHEKLVAYLKNRRAVATIVLIGLLSYIPSEFILSYSEHFITASLATVVYRSWPLLMLLLLPYFLKERLSKYQIFSLLLAFAGIYVAITGGAFTYLLGGADVPVILLLALGAFSYGLGSVLMKKYAFNVESAIFLFNLSLLLLFGFLFLATGSRMSALSIRDVFAVFYIGIAVNIVGYYGYFAALRLLKTTLATNVYFLSPFLTIMFANVILGEAIEPYYLLIAVLVSIGLFVQKFDRIGGTYARSAEKHAGLVIFDVTSAFLSEKEHEILLAMEKGGKVLAVKVHSRHRDNVTRVLGEKDYGNVYTEFGSFSNETKEFVKNMMNVGKDEMAILRAGAAAESEAFFDELVERLNATSEQVA